MTKNVLDKNCRCFNILDMLCCLRNKSGSIAKNIGAQVFVAWEYIKINQKGGNNVEQRNL